MRLRPRRSTPRRPMIAVAAVGLVVGGAEVWTHPGPISARSDQYARMTHHRETLASLDDAEADRIGRIAVEPIGRLEAGGRRGRLDSRASRAADHRAMAAKFAEGRRRPWSEVPLDPPPPGSIAADPAASPAH